MRETKQQQQIKLLTRETKLTVTRWELLRQEGGMGETGQEDSEYTQS